MIVKRPFCDEGHDPRYDLVKKPFNVSTSQLAFVATSPKTSRDAKTFIIIVPPFALYRRVGIQIASERFR